MSNPWPMIHAERAALVADLEGLPDDQWTTPSLCEGWTVQEVLGHMTATAKQTPTRFFRGLAAAGFKFNTMTAKDAAAEAEGTPAETLARVISPIHRRPPETSRDDRSRLTRSAPSADAGRCQLPGLGHPGVHRVRSPGCSGPTGASAGWRGPRRIGRRERPCGRSWPARGRARAPTPLRPRRWTNQRQSPAV